MLILFGPFFMRIILEEAENPVDEFKFAYRLNEMGHPLRTLRFLDLTDNALIALEIVQLEIGNLCLIGEGTTRRNAELRAALQLALSGPADKDHVSRKRRRESDVTVAGRIAKKSKH
jgi:hypothetical protein